MNQSSLTKPDFFVLLPNLISSKISIYIVWMFQLLALLWKCLLSTLMVTFISPRMKVGFCLKIQELRQKMSIFNSRREGMNNDSKCKFFFYFGESVLCLSIINTFSSTIIFYAFIPELNVINRSSNLSCFIYINMIPFL